MWASGDMAFELPQISKIEDPHQLLAQILECIQQKDSRGLKTYILEHKLKNETIFWEVILKLGTCIDSETCIKEPGFFDVCSRCLLYLIKVGNPKETLLALLEQIDGFIDDVKFKNFLIYIQTALLKLPNKLFHSLDITLETVTSHLESLPFPENVQLEGDEIKLFHMDTTVLRLVDNLHDYLTFLEPFVNATDAVSQNMSASARQETLVLKKHLIHVFDHPLSHLILTYNPEADRVKSDSRLCAELAMTLLSKMETDFHRLLKNAQLHNQAAQKHVKSNKEEMGQEEYDNDTKTKVTNNKRVNDENIADIVESWDFRMDISPQAQTCLAYLLYAEGLGLHKLPFVYCHDYTLEFHLGLIAHLLKNTNYPVNYKGLLLCQVLTERVSQQSITAQCLDNPDYMTVINDLMHIMIKCPVRDHRTLATKIFPKFISNFDSFGRYQIYQNILSSCDHSGLKGYLITLLKNDVKDCITLFKSQEKSEDMTEKTSAKTASNSFTGKKLHRLLKLALTLPQQETSDMLENSDQIISSLNFLRFLILADPRASNRTGFWDLMPTVEKDFLSSLRLGLDLSKAHYQLELDNLQQGKNGLVDSDKGPELLVSMKHMNLPALEKQEKLELLEKAVNTHYVMHSLLCRVSELVDQQKHALYTNH